MRRAGLAVEDVGYEIGQAEPRTTSRSAAPSSRMCQPLAAGGDGMAAGGQASSRSSHRVRPERQLPFLVTLLDSTPHRIQSRRAPCRDERRDKRRGDE